MGRAKPWQLVVIVLGLGVLLFSLARAAFSGDTVELATEYVLADVETGDLFAVTRPDGRPIFTPSMNPQSKQFTLFPVMKEGDAWVVSGPPRELLTKSMAAVDDPRSGRIKAKAMEPQRVKYNDLLPPEAR